MIELRFLTAAMSMLPGAAVTGLPDNLGRAAAAQELTQAACSAIDTTDLRAILKPVKSVALTESASRPLAGIDGIALSPTGWIAIVDAHDMAVKTFRPDGSFEGVLGHAGRGPGALRAPSAVVWLDDSTLVVTDETLGKVAAFTRQGRIQWERELPAVGLHGIVQIGSQLYVSGVSGLSQSLRDSAHLLWSVDLRVQEARPAVSPPDSYRNEPVLLLGPVFLTRGDPNHQQLLLTWRLAGELLVIDPASMSSQRHMLRPNRFFVNPIERVQQLSRQERERNPIHHMSPIVSLVASTRLVLVGYFSPFIGEHRVRYHLFDRESRYLGGTFHGPGFRTSRGDSLIALETEGGGHSAAATDSPQRRLLRKLLWYVPCSDDI